MKFKSIFLLFTLLSCTYNVSQSENNIKISVDVKTIPDQGVVISHTRGRVQGLEFDKNNHAEYTIEDRDYVYATIYNGFDEIKFMYLEKGDQINLTFDGKSMAKTLVTTGGHEAIQDYLDNVKINWLPDEAFALEIPAFITRLKEQVAENQKLVDSRTETLNAESKKFVKIEKNRIKYMMGLSILDYMRGHPQMAKLDNYMPGQNYYDALLDWIEEDPDFINISEYRTVVTEAISFVINKGQAQNPYKKVLQQVEYIQSNFKNDRVKQSLINTLTCNYIEENGFNRAKELTDFYQQYITDKDLLSQYQKIYDSWEVVAAGKKALDFQATDSTGKTYSLKDFRGKYVCLYLWPTFQPSINEFAHLQKLSSLFNERNIALVSLSIDETPDSWRQAIQNKELQIGTQLFLGRDKSFLKTYHYNSNYMYQFVLIDPEGNMVEVYAPTPSSGKMEEFIKNNTRL